MDHNGKKALFIMDKDLSTMVCRVWKFDIMLDNLTPS